MEVQASFLKVWGENNTLMIVKRSAISYWVNGKDLDTKRRGDVEELPFELSGTAWAA